MKKLIEIEFSDDFIPPEKFDGVELDRYTRKCLECPLYYHDNECGEGCVLLEQLNFEETLKNKNRCPIRKYFV